VFKDYEEEGVESGGEEMVKKVPVERIQKKIVLDSAPGKLKTKHTLENEAQ